MEKKVWKGNSFKHAFRDAQSKNQDSEVPEPSDKKQRTWKGGFRQQSLGNETKKEQSDRFADASVPSSSSTSPPIVDKPAEDKGLAFRRVIANFFLSNQLSSLQTHDIANSATDAGATGAEDLSSCGNHGRCPQNMHRDLLKKLLKNVKWPKEYWALIPIKNPEDGSTHMVNFPFLLPHEVIKHLVDHHGDLKEFVADLNTILGAVVADSCQALGLNPSEVLGIGLHGDGAPCATKMRESLEQFSWSFCEAPTSSRFVFTAIPKSFVAHGTMDAILSIFTWSLKQLAAGVMPTCRHDGSLWESTDKFRIPGMQNRVQQSGKSIGARALLVQVRGDWMFFKETFSLPSWSSELICWLCRATKSHNSELDFRGKLWRQHRYQPGEFQRLLEQAGKLSPIFGCPGLSIRHFLIDWLHAVDLGVSQSVIGNLFHEIAELLPGATRKDRIASLFKRIKEWYSIAKPPSRLDNLTDLMVKLPGKSPKLRSKAGECRYLVPFAAKLAQDFDDGSTHRNTVSNLLQNLLEVQLCISAEPYDAEKAARACKKFCLLYVALEKLSLANNDELSWRIKPKFHMFEELICYVGIEFGSPRHFWTYQDESWGGWLSHAATRRGGPKYAASCALNLICRYRALVSEDL